MVNKKVKENLVPKNKDTLPKSKDLKLTDLISVFIDGYGKSQSNDGQKEFSEKLSLYLKQEVSKHPSSKDYNILVLFDNSIMVKGDSDQIYKAVTAFEDKNKPLVLVLVSGGGEPGSAYLIGKLCREFCNNKFIVVVPRHAKSAATLLSCAANEIHMGSLSELGPIDPQINGMPTLGLKNSVEHIASLVTKNPGASEMFARYLQRTIEPVQIGYYERVAESLVQYAEKLLNKHVSTLKTSVSEIAEKLVYGYKDHGFVIDKEEATEIFGTDTIKNNTKEYKIGNTIYDVLSEIEECANYFDYNFYFIGSLDSKPSLMKRKKK